MSSTFNDIIYSVKFHTNIDIIFFCVRINLPTGLHLDPYPRLFKQSLAWFWTEVRLNFGRSWVKMQPWCESGRSKHNKLKKNIITGIKFDTVVIVNVNNLIIYWKIPNLHPFKPSCSSDRFIFKHSWKNLRRKNSFAVRMKKTWELFIY